MKTLLKIAFLLGLTIGAEIALPPQFQLIIPAEAQTTLTSTTLTAAVTTTSQGTIQVTSATGFTSNAVVYIDNELMRIAGGYVAGGLIVPVIRGAGAGAGGRAALHVSGSFLYVGPGNAFQNYGQSGACTATNQLYLPWINVSTGDRFLCTDGQWGKLGVFHVPPTQCTFAPTTLTTTNTYIQVGASTAFVLNGTSNAAAGTNTLVCDFTVPTEVTTGRGSVITDITVALGSQTTAPTSLGTSTLSTVTFPTPVATTQTASVVTPVAAGGTVTTVGPTTTVLTVTTAGAFLTFNHAYSTVVEANTDLKLFHYTFPILQSAAAAMTINTPGLFVHYQRR